MVRKKQGPRQSGGLVTRAGEVELGKQKQKQNVSEINEEVDDFDEVDKPFFVDIDRSRWGLEEHRDISEVVITDLSLGEKNFSGYIVDQKFYEDSRFCLRFRLLNVDKSLISRIKLGRWPVLSASSIYLELIEKNTSEELEEMHSVILSGRFDGPEEGVTGLVHLASLKVMSVRPVLGVLLFDDVFSVKVRVEILQSAFDACECGLDNTIKSQWKKSMMSVMAWLRPEVTTSEARYGVSNSTEDGINLQSEGAADNPVSREQSFFDAAAFYEEIKPSKESPMLDDDIPGLLPKLRPYQRRAAQWMVQRENEPSGSSDEMKKMLFSPLCVPVEFVDTSARMFYNPFSGSVSLNPEYSSEFVCGGILADEMGLGKTIEVLTCIFSHRMPPSEDILQATVNCKNTLKRVKKERVECVCGSVTNSHRYKGLWVQCDICDAWQHADCIGYSLKGKKSKDKELSSKQISKTHPASDLRKSSRKRDRTDIVLVEEEHICQLCLELIQATDSPVVTGATLIVCPTPILPQWHAEIIRHTRPGALKTYVYEGVKNMSTLSASAVDIGEFISADIVLTTYDILREDLSHDSDRHRGDRHVMRFKKRYPVIPTLLTRIFWWRICLDEAQMVESNAAAATEMALRLHAKHRWCVTGTPIQRKFDDLYGLMRFLKASPYDSLRWWIEVIRDPYQRRDRGAVTFAHNLFKQIMWRSSKLHVAEELQLPPQDESLSWLSLSPIEGHFYQKQHESCLRYACKVVESFKGSESYNAPLDSSIAPLDATKLLNSLLKLRQACCHPQVGSSGLRSLQQSPMTMQEILQVLVDKAKIEGMEALRTLVSSLNGLAGIAMIKNELSEAVLLYKEALALTKEHSEDFSLDPLLNLHIHHNLAEILPDTLEHSQGLRRELSEVLEKDYQIHTAEYDQQMAKRQKVSGNDYSGSIGKQTDITFDTRVSNVVADDKYCTESTVFSQSPGNECFREVCETITKKYLSTFSSKLSLAQQDFRKLYSQVSNALNDRRDHHEAWWVEALQIIEQDTGSSAELMKKIGDSTSNSLNSSRSFFRSISALKYYIETGLNSLETSRKHLVDQLLEVDQTMEQPREEDIERVRHCSNCKSLNGPICVLCELDDLFQDYEARLFHLRVDKSRKGIIAFASAEEAISLQKKNYARKRFYQKLSPNQDSSPFGVENKEHTRRDVGETVLASKSPSELEAVLGILKSFSRSRAGMDTMSAATNQLLLLESMRKEYAHARSLANAQAQFLGAHDEIKMATSRLRLKENENDKSIDALNIYELEEACVELTNGKLMALASLSGMRGQLRYLKGLVLSKQQVQSEGPSDLPGSKDSASSYMSLLAEERNIHLHKATEEACPICHENLSKQKMVFQCGHVTCCKCLFALTERRLLHMGKVQDKWIMCPTCRQHTNFENIAYANDEDKLCKSSNQGHEKSETSVNVRGSYGTKVEAVTRRILWIKATDPKAKVLVFTSWSDVLDVLEHALKANDVLCTRMKGGRKSQVAINHFQGKTISASGSNSVQVLLLLIQHGANGLNLLEAQHVVLVEPLLNPAAEAQAISRVHRIGQENRTLVHRFLVKDTVEESIFKLNRGRDTSSFISGNRKNQDQHVLTLRDVECLFAPATSKVPESNENPNESLGHLPARVAAGIAAERRLNEHTA